MPEIVTTDSKLVLLNLLLKTIKSAKIMLMGHTVYKHQEGKCSSDSDSVLFYPCKNDGREDACVCSEGNCLLANKRK